MKILHEWNFHNRVCRVVESDPGIVHFEEATRTTGDPSIMLFNHTPTPMGVANEIIQLSMALAEANVINRDLSDAIRRWQEDRNALEQEVERLRARVDELELEVEITAREALDRIAELEGMVPKWVPVAQKIALDIQGWLPLEDQKCGDDERLWLMVPPIPLPETKA